MERWAGAWGEGKQQADLREVLRENAGHGYLLTLCCLSPLHTVKNTPLPIPTRLCGALCSLIAHTMLYLMHIRCTFIAHCPFDCTLHTVRRVSSAQHVRTSREPFSLRTTSRRTWWAFWR